MKAGIYDPYLNILGGGERYVMTLVEYLNQEGYEVDIFWNDKAIKSKIEKQLGINLNRVNFVEDIFYSRGNLPRTTTSWVRGLLKKWKITRRYDLIFYLSDGSVPFLFAKRNILHFQVPFTNVNGRSALNKIKFLKINKVICNSKFTKKFIDKEYGIKSEVVYPPVDVEKFKAGEKEDIILSVGRFTKALHAKKQHILIEVFKKMCNRGLKDWELILIGGTLKGDRNYIKSIRELARNYPIKVLTDIKFSDLKKFYSRAKIFWHAAGFGEDETKHPERMEHFGIAVVEAMAAGCVPIVINKGGLSEIVTHKVNGLLWETRSDLIKATLQLIKSQNLWQKLSSQAIKDSQKFSKKVFCRRIYELIKS
jgi:glycosyltransferase involved in cell wall biosynthesis